MLLPALMLLEPLSVMAMETEHVVEEYDNKIMTEIENEADEELEADSVIGEGSSIVDSLNILNSKGQSDINALLSGKTVQAVVYLCDSYELKASPSKSADTVTNIKSGNTVKLLSIDSDSAINEYSRENYCNNKLWYKVNVSINDLTYEGFIEKEFLAYSDEELLALEAEYDLPDYMLDASNELVESDIPNAKLITKDVAAFPLSYQPYLYALKNQHPNWTFARFDTDLNWDDVVWEEYNPGQSRSWVYITQPTSWRYTATKQKNWWLASEAAVKYVLDPRNFLGEKYIFMFEQLTYNSSYHNESAVQLILNGSFMEGQVPDTDQSYANIFYEIGSSIGVSPFHLACRVYQEQGKNGSAMVSGNYPGFEGLYNYFNVGATGATNEAVIKNGLTYARNAGWDSHSRSLWGGATVISANYILAGQDTLYLEKFDVENQYKGLYKHQYMQNITAPMTESVRTYTAYKNADSLDNRFVFKIPVYNNMPDTAVTDPDGRYNEPPEMNDEYETDYKFPFKDVTKDNWYYSAVYYVNKNGIMNGIDASTFNPLGKTSRAMVVTILYNMEGKPEVGETKKFKDCYSGKWYMPGVSWAVQNNIVTGKTGDTFAPNDNISRQDVAVILYRYAKFKGYDVSKRSDLSKFSDSDYIKGYAIEALSWANGNGIINGNTNNCILPKGEASRAEIATMIMNFKKKY